MTDDDQREAETPFAWVPGYHYALMGFISIPHEHSMFGKGGNLTTLLYRKEHSLTRWYMKFRFRHYHGPDPHDQKDVRNWNLAVFDMPKEQAVARAKMWLEIIGGISGKKPDFFEIDGDCVKFAFLPKPFWMHESKAGAE